MEVTALMVTVPGMDRAAVETGQGMEGGVRMEMEVEMVLVEDQEMEDGVRVALEVPPVALEESEELEESEVSEELEVSAVSEEMDLMPTAPGMDLAAVMEAARDRGRRLGEEERENH